MTEVSPAAAPPSGDGDDLDLPSLSFTADDYDLLDAAPGPVVTVDDNESAPLPATQPTPTQQPQSAPPQTTTQQPTQSSSQPATSPASASNPTPHNHTTAIQPTPNDTTPAVSPQRADETEVTFETAHPSQPTTTSAPATAAQPEDASRASVVSTAETEDEWIPDVQLSLSPLFIQSVDEITAIIPSPSPAATPSAEPATPTAHQSLASPPPHASATATTAAAQPVPPSPSSHTTRSAHPQIHASISSAPNAIPLLSPATPTSTSSSSSKPTHRTRPSSILLFERNKTTLNLDALQLNDPLDYLRMLRTVLTLQRKCRIWRNKTRAKIKLRIETEKTKQEQEMQLKLYNKRQQRKLSEAFRQSQANLPAVLPDEPVVAVQPVQSKERKVWSVELPDSEEHRLKFTICMMKIQRAFRGKLSKARVRLQEKLKAEKDQQEKEMIDKIEKRKAAKLAAAAQQSTQQQQQQQQQQPVEVEAVTVLPIQTLQSAEGEEVLQGSLTSRLRKDRERRREEREKEDAERRGRMVDSQVQVDVDELRETAALNTIPTSALFVPLTSPTATRTSANTTHTAAEDSPPVSAVAAMSVPVVPDSRLKEQHLRILALLSTLPTTATPTAVPRLTAASTVSNGKLSAGVVGYVVGHVGMGELEWVSDALYERVFGSDDSYGGNGKGRVDGLDVDDEDWESIVHLPLPVVVLQPVPVPASPVIEL